LDDDVVEFYQLPTAALIKRVNKPRGSEMCQKEKKRRNSI